MDLHVSPRTQFGKAVGALRGRGMIPAELYGHGFPNGHLALSKRDFEAVFAEAGESTVVTLVGEEEKVPALIYDVQRDYLTDEIIHVDLYRVRMDQAITARVPLEFIGEAPGVKDHGGVLNKTLSEIEVEALPGDLPRLFEIDVSNLTDLDQSIYVKDLQVSDKVKVLLDPETVIVTLTPPAPEEEQAPVEPIDVSSVKVESEEKRAEREAERTKETSEEGGVKE